MGCQLWEECVFVCWCWQGWVHADRTECAFWRLQGAAALSLLWVLITPGNLKVSAFNYPGTVWLPHSFQGSGSLRTTFPSIPTLTLSFIFSWVLFHPFVLGSRIRNSAGSPSWSWLSRLSKSSWGCDSRAVSWANPPTHKGCQNGVCIGDFSWKYQYQQIWGGIYLPGQRLVFVWGVVEAWVES